MKKILVSAALLCCATFAFPQSGERLARFPVVFEIDGEDVVADSGGQGGGSKGFAGAEIAAADGEEAREQISALLDRACAAAKAGDFEALSSYLSDPNDARKAAKLLKMLGVSSSSDASAPAIARVFDSYIAPFKPASKKFRRGMNAFVFKRTPGGLKWNLKVNDPLVGLLADSAAFANPRAEEAANIKLPRDPRSGATLPAANFCNSGIAEGIEAAPGIEGLPAAKFYHDAQELFFSYKLEDYAKFMTPKSREKFSAQYLSMDDAQRKEALGEYFSWRKKYLCLLDAGSLQILIFNRLKDGQTPQIDLVYLPASKEGFKIANFGSNKTRFDMFLSKYLYPTPGRSYAEKFEKVFK